MKLQICFEKLFLLFVVLFVFGCNSSGGSGSQDGRDTEAPSVPANLSAFNSDSAVQLSWTASTDDTAVTDYKIYRNGVYLASSSANEFTDSDVSASSQYCYAVSALDEAGNESSASVPVCADGLNGRVKWRFATETPVTGSVAVDSSGTIYAADENTLYAINPDGSLKWKFLPESAGMAFYDANPVIGPDNTIYIQTQKGVCALNRDGTLKIKETAYFCSAAGTAGGYYKTDYDLISFNPDGTEKWRFSPGWQQRFTSPALGQDGTVYTASYYSYNTGHAQPHTLYAIDPDGHNKWANSSYLFNSSPVIGHDGTLYIASKNDNFDHDSILALNQDGTLRWKTETGGYVGSSLGVDAAGTVFVMSKDGYLKAIGQNGAVKWSCFTGASAKSPAIAPDGTIYVGSTDRAVYAVSSDSPGIAPDAWARSYRNNSNSGILRKIVIDSDPPSVPGNVKASAIATTMVQLDWESSTDNSTHITGYNIYRDGSCLGLKNKGFTDSGLSQSTRYCYRIAAVDAVGNESEKSPEVCVETPAPADGILKWKYDTSWLMHSSNLAIGKDESIIAYSYESVLAVNPSGTVKWTHQISPFSGLTASIDRDGNIYVGNLYAFDPNGSLLWDINKPGAIADSFQSIGADGTIYASHWNLSAINPDGSFKWDIEAGANSSSIGSDGTIYAHTENHLSAISPDGRIIWNYPGYFSEWISSAIGTDGTIYLVGTDRGLSAINPNGTLKWEYQEKSLCSPVIGSDGTIYTGGLNYFYALKPDGSLKWKYETGQTCEVSAAIGSDGIVYFGTAEGCLYALKPDGTLKWKYQVNGSEYSDAIYMSPAIAADGTLYFAADTYLYAIQTSSMGLATGGWPKIHHDNQNTGRMP